MIKSFADRLSQSALMRHLFFIVLTLITVGSIGYLFGTFDQDVHIPYLKQSVDPALYPGDPFLNLRFFHYSYFWYLFQPFLRLGILEPVMFVVHLVMTYFTYWMMWELSMTLFKSPLTALITSLALIFPHVGLGGYIIIEFSLLNRTFVLPFLLAALVFYLRRRYWPTFLILGLMYNLHVLSVAFVLAMILLDCLMRWREIGWRNIILGMVLFVIGATPVFFWKVSHTGIDFSLRPEILTIAARGTLGQLYYTLSGDVTTLGITLCGIGALGMFVTAWRNAPSAEHNRTVMNFVYAIGIIFAVQVITTYWLPVTIILQMQIIRVAFYLLIFAYLYFAHLIVQSYQEGALSKSDFWIQAGAYIVLLPPPVPWLLWFVRKWIAGQRWRQMTVAVLIAAGVATTVVLSLKNELFYFGIHIYGPRTPWVDTQLWAKNNTPKDTRFITPPQLGDFTAPDWRVFSERPPVATLPELQEAPFRPESLADWETRFSAVAPGAIERFHYDYFSSRAYAAEAYYSLDSEAIIQVAREYHASYLVIEKPHLHDFPVAYENSVFVVYDLREYID